MRASQVAPSELQGKCFAEEETARRSSRAERNNLPEEAILVCSAISPTGIYNKEGFIPPWVMRQRRRWGKDRDGSGGWTPLGIGKIKVWENSIFKSTIYFAWVNYLSQIPL